ncbi:uncharacterized protein LOC142662238 isoform X4 [Rhinoderma darwinii]|uniref:uncharacterized protein LOC142662238 isoform X4 n=1 Tax=Rhinoderma darwinii TaxID=43563 RepID=UPI003F678EC8
MTRRVAVDELGSSQSMILCCVTSKILYAALDGNGGENIMEVKTSTKEISYSTFYVYKRKKLMSRLIPVSVGSIIVRMQKPNLFKCASQADITQTPGVTLDFSKLVRAVRSQVSSVPSVICAKCHLCQESSVPSVC